ncbi:hypothetical protein E2C01_044283 [Portunus trituberculatus]|uniref:Uncharacterized protein n=1 Tax=Portunus trituberculatus TaxID=210409 RepID=A0A5B7FYT3_PORTR|nr:hypothetical protein [Portunus trituberculatus]
MFAKDGVVFPPQAGDARCGGKRITPPGRVVTRVGWGGGKGAQCRVTGEMGRVVWEALRARLRLTEVPGRCRFTGMGSDGASLHPTEARRHLRPSER